MLSIYILIKTFRCTHAKIAPRRNFTCALLSTWVNKERERGILIEESAKDDIKVNRGHCSAQTLCLEQFILSGASTPISQAAAHAMLLAESCNIIIIGSE
jgi:hypothetical protein